MKSTSRKLYPDRICYTERQDGNSGSTTRILQWISSERDAECRVRGLRNGQMQTPKVAFAAALQCYAVVWSLVTSWKTLRLFHVLASKLALRFLRRVQMHIVDKHVLQSSIARAAAGDEDVYVWNHCSALYPQRTAWDGGAWRVADVNMVWHCHWQ